MDEIKKDIMEIKNDIKDIRSDMQEIRDNFENINNNVEEVKKTIYKQSCYFDLQMQLLQELRADLAELKVDRDYKLLNVIGAR